MSKLKMRPKREPCPPGNWQVLCFKEGVEEFKTKDGRKFKRQVFRFQVWEGDGPEPNDKGPGLQDWHNDDGSVRQIRYGSRTSLPAEKNVGPTIEFMRGGLGGAVDGCIEELDNISTGKKERFLETKGMVNKRFTAEVIINDRGYSEVGSISAPDQDVSFEFIDHFPDRDGDSALPF